jgi:hypothetical protein
MMPIQIGRSPSHHSSRPDASSGSARAANKFARASLSCGVRGAAASAGAFWVGSFGEAAPLNFTKAFQLKRFAQQLGSFGEVIVRGITTRSSNRAALSLAEVRRMWMIWTNCLRSATSPPRVAQRER